MKKNISLLFPGLIICLFFAVVLLAAATDAAAQVSRRRWEALQEALDEYDPSSPPPAPRPVYADDEMPDERYTVVYGPPYEYPKKHGDELNLAEESEQKQKEDDDPSLWEPSLSSWDIGAELFGYSFSGNDQDVEESGVFFGLLGSYTFRRQENEPIRSFKESFSPDSNLNLFRLEGRLGFGTVDYDSSTYSGDNDADDVLFGLRGLLGYELPWTDDWMFMPYFGVGYRYLHDGLEDIEATSSTYSGYDREFTYWYVPVGIEAIRSLENDWSLKLAFELDFLLTGEQISELQDMSDNSGASAGQGQLENDLDSGLGILTSLRMSKRAERIDFFAEPFFRYWTVDGTCATVSCNSCIGGYDPDHSTAEYGLRFGLLYN